MTASQHFLAGIELGGTKTVVVLGRSGRIVAREAFATTTPEETLGQAASIIGAWQSTGRGIAGLGIGSFGPVRLDRRAEDFGRILATPKPGWEGASVLEPFQSRIDVPTALDTDVNAAAMAEHAAGAAQGCSSVVYLTIGTGVGGGLLIQGMPAHGLLHPELGHLRLRRSAGDGFAGSCRFHGDCIEGLIGGPALAARFGRHPAAVPQADPAWEPVASDLAELIAHLLLAISPQRIVIGGGVTNGQPHLLEAARAKVPRLLAGYIGDVTAETLEEIVVPPALGNDAGPVGALILAGRAAGVQFSSAST